MKDLRFELKRQFVHIILGVSIILLGIFNITLTSWVLFYLGIFFFLLSLIQIKFKFRIINLYLSHFERESTIRKFPFKGALFFIVGSLLVLRIFEPGIALASITILTFGDSISHLIGKFGSRKNPIDSTKNIEGAVFAIIIASFASSIFVPLFFGFVAALFAMVFEALSFKLQGSEVDDNVVIPLIAGTTIFLLQKIF